MNEKNRVCDANSGLINRAGGVLINTQSDLAHARLMIEMFNKAWPAMPQRVITTHEDADQVWGNQLFEGAEIIAHRSVPERMKQVAEPKESQKMLHGVGRFLTRLVLKVFHPGIVAAGQQLLEDYNFDGIELVLPTTLFDACYELNLDGTEVHLIYVGPCHQVGDTIIHVPKERVVFAGDVLFRQCTSTGWTGSYEKWFQCLELMIQLDPEVIVPGHGPLCGIEGAMEMKAYLQYVRDESKKCFDTGLPSLEAAKRIEFGPYGEWRAPARLYMNVERTYCAFRNEPPNAPWDTAVTPRRLLPGREGERNRSRILTPFKELKPPYTKRTTAMKFPMIHTDEQGETHFDVRDIQDRELAMGPPPNPTGQLSDFGPVTTMCVISFPAGTEAPPHNAPQPYICIVLSGEGEVVTSDGEARRFQPGAVLFCDDLTGKGHVTRALTDVTLAFINRVES